jgi:hypothetical protein
VWAYGLHVSVTDNTLPADYELLLADFLNTYAPDLVSLVFATAPIYFDAKSQRMVEGFIQEAVANSDVFLKTFAAGLITFDASNRSKQVHSTLGYMVLSSGVHLTFTDAYKCACMHPCLQASL